MSAKRENLNDLTLSCYHKISNVSLVSFVSLIYITRKSLEQQRSNAYLNILEYQHSNTTLEHRYKEKLVLSLANDVREVNVLLTTQASLIFEDIDEENSEIENLESVMWARLSKLDRLISQHVENVSRWILERFVKSSVLVPTFESAYVVFEREVRES